MKFREVFLWPLIVSSLGWPVYAMLLIPYQGTGLEAAGYLVFFASFLLFSISGPLAAATLGGLVQRSQLSLGRFLAIFFLITSPMIVFQTYAVGVSVGGFFFLDFARVDLISQFRLYTCILVICTYAVEAIVIYALAKIHADRGVLGAIALAALNVAILVSMVVHS